MASVGRRTFGFALVSAGLAMAGVLLDLEPARAVEVGQPAPDFRLPSTLGGEVTLGEFRGKSFVLLEFYGTDFAPT